MKNKSLEWMVLCSMYSTGMRRFPIALNFNYLDIAVAVREAEILLLPFLRKIIAVNADKLKGS